MSRVGNKQIEIKAGVELQVSGRQVKAKGPKGELEITLDKNLELKVDGNIITVVSKKEDDKETRELHGLTRSLVANMVQGVSEGFEKKLEFRGVGYKANMESRDLVLSLGYSHPIRYTPQEGVEIKTEKNTIIVSGIDKQQVGQAAAEIRAFRKPEPYKGKGIRYEGEHIRRKAGKAAAKGAE